MAQPFFSIIVPIYKTEAYLRQCVDSVLGQTYADFEVILVDDGSPDGCPAICDEYAAKDPRVKVVHKQNGGLVSARKAGLAECTGKYVMNVDSDDYIAPDLLENVAKAATRYAPQVILFGLTCFEGDTTENKKSALAPGLYEGEAMQTVRNGLICSDAEELAVPNNLCAKAVLRELYAPFQMAVPETLTRGEDLAVTAPMLAASQKVYIAQHYGYFYRQNPTSIMHTFKPDEMDRLMQLARHLADQLDAPYERKIDMFIRRCYFDYLDRAMLQGKATYWQMVRRTQVPEIQDRVRRARSDCGLKRNLAYFLLRHRCYRLLWLFRKIKSR